MNSTLEAVWVETAWSNWLADEGHDPQAARFWRAEWSRGFLAAREKAFARPETLARTRSDPKPPKHTSWAFRQGWAYYWKTARLVLDDI